MTRVAIGIITCRRPAGLDRLLASVAALAEAEDPPAVRSVIVVDNDRSGSAREVVEKHRREGLSITYAIESRPGIPYARNTVIDQMSRDTDFLAFVDDDEVVDVLWLQRMLAAQARYDADVTTGPVLPIYEEGVPRWTIDGGFFERERFATGTVLPTAATNNVLIRAALFDNADLRFDPRLALSGGSDTELFNRMARGGRRIVWCDDALVSEYVPAQRATVRWILQRQYRRSAVKVYLQRQTGRSVKRDVLLGMRSAARTLKGLLLVAPMSMRGRVGIARALLRSASGLGALLYLLGVRYNEYAVRHR